MPVCIYCSKIKLTAEFSKEHVLPRAFCGQGGNWTLVHMVCGACNGRLSAFESHWTHQALESMTRNFSGPVGRGGQSKEKRIQPIEIDHLYLVQKDDSIVYEAGFAFPNKHYFRPQIIQIGGGLMALAADEKEGQTLDSVIKDLRRLSEIALSRPLGTGDKKAFRIVRVSLDSSGKSYSVGSEREGTEPVGYWLRSYPEAAAVKRFDGIERHLTPRCAVDDRKRLYFRARDWSEVAGFLSNLAQGKLAPPEKFRKPSPGTQQVILGFRIELPLVYRAVLKTGLNLVAHLAGAPLARDAAFDDLRRILLDKDADSDVMERCTFSDHSMLAPGRAEFPPGVNINQHRLMLDIFRGNLCFRMRLYGHVGYESILAPATSEIKSVITTSRVVVDFDSTGIREVSEWPRG